MNKGNTILTKTLLQMKVATSANKSNIKETPD